jgi:heme exporter protein D
MLVFVAAVVWTCRNSTKDRPRWQLAAEYALILLGMLLFSERTWKHHCVLLLVPFGVLSYCLAEVQVSQKVKRYVIATLIIVVLLMASTSTGWSRSFDRVGELAQVYGAYVWANLALVIALVVVLRCDFLSARRQVLSEVSQVSAARKRGAARKQINHEPPAHTERGSPECALSN